MTEAGTTASSAKTSRWVMDKAHSSVWFSARQLGISSIRGWFREFEVDLRVEDEKPETAKVKARIDASSLDTGNDFRDKHLKGPDFLDVTAHTTINRTEWGLTWNVPIADSLLVSEDIELTIDVSFAEETAAQ